MQPIIDSRRFYKFQWSDQEVIPDRAESRQESPAPLARGSTTQLHETVATVSLKCDTLASR